MNSAAQHEIQGVEQLDLFGIAHAPRFQVALTEEVNQALDHGAPVFMRSAAARTLRRWRIVYASTLMPSPTADRVC